jgi:hypothetical protein
MKEIKVRILNISFITINKKTTNIFFDADVCVDRISDMFRYMTVVTEQGSALPVFIENIINRKYYILTYCINI